MTESKEYVSKIEEWSKERGLDKQNPERQLLKLYEEFGELAAGISKNDVPLIKDSVGDVFVVLVILAQQLDIDFNDIEECAKYSYAAFGTVEGHMMRFQRTLGYLTDAIDNSNISETLRLCLFLAYENLDDLCNSLDVKLNDCVRLAYEVIKDRKGKVINGTFVKESDL